MRIRILLAAALIVVASCATRVSLMYTPHSLEEGKITRIDEGNPHEGRELFAKLRCDSCHTVSGTTGKGPHPLPDLTAYPPEAIANLIVERTDLAPEALFDEMAMSAAASQMSQKQLAHVVAYLKNPKAARVNRS